MTRRLVARIERLVGLKIIDPRTYEAVPKDKYDLVPKGQYDYVPKGTYVFGPADRFLLVPKNRYRVSLLPGQELSADLGIGWLTETNTSEDYDRLWGDDKALDVYKSEGDGVRDRMPFEIVEAVGGAVDRAAHVMDVGCGAGDLLTAARRRNSRARLSGCDFSAAAVARAQTALPDAQIEQAHIVDQLSYPDDQFDMVFCTDVLEHLEHPGKVVGELVRICAPGGTVAVVVPDGAVDQFLGHLWFWSEETLREFLSPWKARVWRLPDCKEFIGVIEKPEGSSGRTGS